MIEFTNIYDLQARELQTKIREWERQGDRSITVVMHLDGDVTILSPSSEAETRRIMFMVAGAMTDKGMH